MKKKFKLTLAYDGTAYSGWQVQPNGVTIQGLLQEKLNILLKEEVSVIGAGRTDAGVHALKQVAHFCAHCPLDPYKMRASLNGMLPKDIRVKDVEMVPDDFHARFSAVNKTYHYHLNLGPVQDPFIRLYSWHITEELNLKAMQESAKHFMGTHDFTSFANEPGAGGVKRNPVRTIKRIELFAEKEGLRLEFEAEGFLYKMVRNLTGFIVEAGRGKRAPEESLDILAAKDRRRAGHAAPPQGLFLIGVDY